MSKYQTIVNEIATTAGKAAATSTSTLSTTLQQQMYSCSAHQLMIVPTTSTNICDGVFGDDHGSI